VARRVSAESVLIGLGQGGVLMRLGQERQPSAPRSLLSPALACAFSSLWLLLAIACWQLPSHSLAGCGSYACDDYACDDYACDDYACDDYALPGAEPIKACAKIKGLKPKP
jgi:hypothetical protein